MEDNGLVLLLCRPTHHLDIPGGCIRCLLHVLAARRGVRSSSNPFRRAARLAAESSGFRSKERVIRGFLLVSSSFGGLIETTRAVTGSPWAKCLERSETTIGFVDASAADTRPATWGERHTQTAFSVASRTQPVTIWPGVRSSAVSREMALEPLPEIFWGRIVHSMRSLADLRSSFATCRLSAAPPPSTTTCTCSAGGSEGKTTRCPGDTSSVKCTRPRKAPFLSSTIVNPVDETPTTRASA
eukprot:scaffold194248_cov27-Tisochrysis_lutea.AAC.4